MRWLAQGLLHGRTILGVLRLSALLLCVGSLPAQTAAPSRSFPDCVKPVAPETPVAQLKRSRPAITRNTLTAAETAAPLEVEVAFSMRNFPELQRRIAQGQLISSKEMAARYLPLPADYDKVADWLIRRGLKITRRDPNRIALFVQGSVHQLADTFSVSFARVAYRDKEYTSAVSAPSVPADVATPLLGINGLQPHLRMEPHALPFQALPDSTTADVAPFTPAQIAQAYNAAGLTQTGAGQTIAIVIDTFPNDSDLTSFWSQCNVPQSLGNISFIQAVPGTLSASSLEDSLDVEWTSSIASAAKIRVYATVDLSFVHIDTAYEQLITDLPSQPTLHQLSLSFGAPEIDVATTQLQTDSQYFAEMAGAGVTVCISTGDGGSRPNASSGQYDANSPPSPETPSSDPSVTAVGGTTLNINSTTGNVTSETVWGGTGGGISTYFSRPTWQTGSSVPGGNMRMVPDVAADADPNTGGLVVLDGASLQVGGTSLAAPTWAAFCALINQARAAAGQPSLGYLNPKIYPLLGSASFRDITSGSNGDYSAGPGYDLCTGLGVPVVSTLLNALINSPAITSPPTNQEVTVATNATFSLSAIGSGTLTYQWQRMPIGSSTWANLTDNATYSGSATSALTVANTSLAMSGDQFECLVSNAFGSVINFPSATLIVDVPLVVTTLAGLAGSQGSTNGNTTAARFSNPAGVAVDSAGNVYVADSNNQLIRKITPGGNVTTLAGSADLSGSSNGNGTAARFSNPQAVATDSSGNIYVADANNQLIRKITPAGNVTTFAGQSGRRGSNNGTGTSARFFNPLGVTVDSAGNVYVADANNQVIRKITSTGTVSTFAGQTGFSGSVNDIGPNAQFSFPSGVAVDSSGNVYVADTDNQLIRKITSNGTVTTFAGQAGVSGNTDGLVANAQFSFPTGLAVDSAGNVYVADNQNSVIRKISLTGVVSTPAGLPDVNGSTDDVGANARFRFPNSVALDSVGNVYVADTNNDTIRKAGPIAGAQIQTSPQNQTAVAGTNATFSVTASGNPPPAFQWQLSLDNGATWSNLTDNATYSGSATASLTVTTTAAMNGNQFRALASNAFGSATSAASTLTVNFPPAFTTQPQSLTITTGQPASFSAAASGQPAPAYQWQVSTDGITWSPLTDNGAILGSATANLSVNNASVALSGGQFQCVATNGISPNAISNPATLTVTALSLAQTTAALGLTGASALPTARPYPDGLPNLANYAMNLGASPTAAQLPTTGLVTSNGVSCLTLQYRVLKGLVGVTVTVTSSTDLLNWTPIPLSDITQLPDDDAQTSRYQATVPLPAQPLFLRLEFTETP